MHIKFRAFVDAFAVAIPDRDKQPSSTSQAPAGSEVTLTKG